MALPDSTNGHGFVVTVRDVWNELQEVKDSVHNGMDVVKAGISELKGQITLVTDGRRAQRRWQDDIEIRVRRLERWRYALPISALLAIISVTTMVLDLVTQAGGKSG